MKKQNYFKIKNRRGMTFVELMVSVFILSITIVTSTAVCVSYLNNRTAIKRYQENTEELSLAMNQLSKEIRMSNCEKAGECVFSQSSIILKNNASKELITYIFNDNNKEMTRNGEIIATNVEGRFYMYNQSSDNSTISRVTINIMKSDDERGIDYPDTAVQTTVSMRSGYSSD